jgi:hypothetical protein
VYIFGGKYCLNQGIDKYGSARATSRSGNYFLSCDQNDDIQNLRQIDPACLSESRKGISRKQRSPNSNDTGQLSRNRIQNPINPKSGKITPKFSFDSDEFMVLF